MKRLTFDGNFCDIAMCGEMQGGPFCEDGACSQRKTWERLKVIEDILGSEYDLDRLRELGKTEKNEPLTLHELRNMVGEHVWLPDGDCWVLVSKRNFVTTFVWPYGGYFPAADWYSVYGFAYRNKPKR